MQLTSKALLITGPQHAKLLINHTLDTVSGMFAVTTDALYFEEARNPVAAFFCANTFAPGKSFRLSLISDVASVGVVTLSDKEFRRTHPGYWCVNPVNLFKKPKACVCITLITREQIILCPIPKNENIAQEEYAYGLVKLIQNAKAEKLPNTNEPCGCCGRIMSVPQNFCELCGTPIRIVKRIAASDGVKRALRITLTSGKEATFKTDRGHEFTLTSMQSAISKPVAAVDLKCCSPKMVLFVTTAYHVKRLELSLDGDGELQVNVDKPYGKILCVNGVGGVRVTREDLAAPRLPYYGDMAVKPDKPYDERDNVLLIDP